jgi:flagellar biosynthetic protein FliP
VTELLGVVGALGFVLGLLFLAVALLKRFRGLPASGPSATLEVVARAGLAPKQGVALVRMGARVVALSWGEGGVRTLAELDPEELEPRRRGRTFEETYVQARSLEEIEERIVDAEDAFGEDDIDDGTIVFPPDRPWLLNRADLAGDLFGWIRRFANGVVRRMSTGPATWMVVGALVAGALSVRAVPLHGQGAVPPIPAPSQVVPGGADSGALPDGSRLEGVPDAAGILDALERAGGSQGFSMQLGDDEEGLTLSGPVGMVVVMGALTLLPTFLLLMTSFTRILVVLNLLKQALGLQAAPPGQVLVALSLLLTGFVMAPTIERANTEAFAPWVAGEIESGEMLERTLPPFREFMLRTTREEDLSNFVRLSGQPAPSTVDEIPTVVLASAFVTSELRAAFQIGFALFLPFVIVDLVVAAVLMSMGMFMLPPVMVSLPLKLLLFVMVDGWGLIVDSLVRSFA